MHERRVPIPKPCQVEWQELTPLAKAGRYCAQCKHAVIDLSALTEAQAERVLRARKPNTCVSYVRDEEGRIAFRAPSTRDINPVTAALGAMLSLAACSTTSSKSDGPPALDSVSQPLASVESIARAAADVSASSHCASDTTEPAATEGWPGAQPEVDPATKGAGVMTAEARRRKRPPHVPTADLPKRERSRFSGMMVLGD